MILEVKDINTYYGTSHILFDVSLDVDKGEILALLGRNGAGKTTTLRSIMGLTPPRNGTIKFQGKEIKGNPPYIIARQGLGFVPDDRAIFGTLTVKQNLEVVARKGNKGLEWTLENVYELFPVLRKLESRKGGQLSGGEQQMLTVARTLMTNPQMLLLDEPLEGLSPLIVKTLAEKIMELKAKGLTMLLSEQNVKFARELSDRAYVIDKGVIRFQGSIEELRGNEEVREKYLMI
jgi:branched-chain amino acid transport system ATP-binding protein